MEVKFITIEQAEYFQACQLRHQVFFAEHNLPFTILFDDQEAISFHAVITNLHNKVIAYGRLTRIQNNTYQISQMVVKPDCQRQGLGQQILLALINLAKKRGANLIALEARTSAVKFYQKLGFETDSPEYPSKKTGVIHVNMKLKLI